MVISNKDIKLLYVNGSDIQGGAAIGGYRLHKALLTAGIDSKMLVKIKKTNDHRVQTIHSARQRVLEAGLSRISEFAGFTELGGISSFKINTLPWYKDADILNLHCMHGRYFNYLSLPRLSRYKPTVYKLSDMWTFTGHCAYSFECERWQTGCGNCPDLSTYPAVKVDNTHLEWQLKRWIYRKSNLSIVCPSKWLAEQAEKSILNRFPIYHIPNGIDTKVYQPIDPVLCRTVLGLPENKRVIAFAAQNLSDPRKGSDLLLKALQKIPASFKKDLQLLILGNQSEGFLENIDISATSLGYVEGDLLKAIFYSAADLFLCPTRADNLPLVLQESMACGTPMVSFDIGGVPDLVRPDITGYLAKPEDAQDFCNGIIQLLEDSGLREKMSRNCRAIACEEYPIELQAQRYIELYKNILSV